MIRHINFFKSHSLHQWWHSPLGIAYTGMKGKNQPPAWKKYLEAQFDCNIMRAGKKRKLSTFTVTHKVYKESSTRGKKPA